MAPDSAALAQARIRNAAWMVLHYWRGRRSSIQREARRRAIAELGAICREAFTRCETPEDFEMVLSALLDGLAPHDEKRF